MTRVLVVDDQRMFADAVAEIIRDTGTDASVRVVATGRDALQALEHDALDFALIDYHLPDVDGAELIRRARELKPYLRLVAMSADPSPRVREECMAAGADAMIPKDRGLGAILKAIGVETSAQ